MPAGDFHHVGASAGQGPGVPQQVLLPVPPRGDEHQAVLADPEQEVVARFPGLPHRLVIVAAAVADVHPAAPRRRRPDRPEPLGPQVRLPGAALALIGALPGRGGPTGPELLVGQAEHPAAVGQDGQAVVLEESPAVALADGAGAPQGVVAGEVQLRGVVQDQHQRVAAHGLAGEFPVGALHGGQGGFLPVAQSVESPQLVPVEHLGEGLLGAGGDGRGGVEEASGAAAVAEVGPAEVLLGPGAGIGDDVHVHLRESETMGDPSVRM